MGFDGLVVKMENINTSPTTDRRFSKSLFEDISKQSLLNAMNKFVTAVNSMDENVMIPTRLLDVPLKDETSPSETASSKSKSVLPVGLSKSCDDLYSFYVMLNAIKTDLVDGPQSDDEFDESSSEGSEDGSMPTDSRFAQVDEQSRQLAGAFRHHLQGLFGVLHQLTDTANHVSNRYQQEINK